MLFHISRNVYLNDVCIYFLYVICMINFWVLWKSSQSNKRQSKEERNKLCGKIWMSLDRLVCPNFSLLTSEVGQLISSSAFFLNQTETWDQKVSPDENGVSGGILYIKIMAFVVLCFHLVNINSFIASNINFKFLSVTFKSS